MIRTNDFYKLFKCIPGFVLVSFGVYLHIRQPLTHYIINQARESVVLQEGKLGYEYWKNIDIFFKVWIFQVMNPGDVMTGQFPVFRERGPYIYNLNLKKHVTSVDIEKDEINFTVLRTYQFNQKESGVLSENDMVTTLNFAYLGTITTMAATFPGFLKKLGNPISLLFPNMEDLFLRGRVRDLLFDGLPLVCDKNKHKDLQLICTFLKSQKPPIIENTKTDNVYSYSFFNNVNMTELGPFTVNRGVKNKNSLGNITTYKGMGSLKYWSDEQCNLVSGTDTMTWPPMTEKLPFVSVFEPNLCRSLTPYFKKEVIIHGLIGYRYELQADNWKEENVACYCPINKKKVKECLPTGLMDITKCQEVPVIFSEPHFLNGHEHLTEYAHGVRNDPELHSTFITIEPLSGAPLSGSKKLQLNMKLINIPSIEFLTNVSEGYFPILWAEETSNPSVELLRPVIQFHRLLNFSTFFPSIPISLGILWIIKVIFLYDSSRHIVGIKVYSQTRDFRF